MFPKIQTVFKQFLLQNEQTTATGLYVYLLEWIPLFKIPPSFNSNMLKVQ